ncbi:hypothetical protein R7P34_17885 [Vibrio sp. 780]|uniref:hypothetical protein n=1 Tax=unclassified Vibrio TaxID=2614977 RepID=UPI002963C9D4|nr:MULTISPECIES: hypothetical protein [unclassified Vibrio]MDW1949171.1 hypothetical protein [Vibrio sp. 812(2023)]MDW1992284.1 hypothetical protein [Vibrio sp. 780]
MKALFSNGDITTPFVNHAENIVIRFEAVNNGNVTVIYQSFPTLKIARSPLLGFDGVIKCDGLSWWVSGGTLKHLGSKAIAV